MLKKYIDYILVFLFSFIVFIFMLKCVSTDIQLHINSLIRRNISGGEYEINFLLHYLVNIFSFFTNNRILMEIAMLVILSSSVLLKYIITKNIILGVTTRYVNVITVGLILFFAIPDPYSIFILKKMYIGRIVPVVWHNPTTILLFPFAILLFYKQLRVFDNNSNRDLFVIFILIILNAIIKPSFLLVYLPVTFLFLMKISLKKGFKWLIRTTTPLVLGGVTIFIQYYYIYYLGTRNIHPAGSSGIIISEPFEFFSNILPVWYIPISFLLSLLFFIISLVIFKDVLLRYTPFSYALSLFILGFFISAFILESGPRIDHGNLLWQNVICSYLLVLTTVSFIVPRMFTNGISNRKKAILISILSLHIISGFLYLLKIALTLDYA